MSRNVDTLAENQPVNLTLLDGFVVDFLYQKGVLDENPNREGAEAFTKYRDQMESLRTVRSLVLQGQVAEAMRLVDDLLPAVLQDTRLLFRLRKQHFVEMLRRGEDPKEALAFAQAHLLPLGLTVSPESYTESKNCLLLVLFKETDQLPALAAEWAPSNRAELASLLHASMLAALGVEETAFALLVRYLITVHNLFHVMNGLTSPFDEVEKLVLPDKIPARTGRDIPTARQIQVNDVQSLQQTLSISQQDAINALRLTGGNLEVALKNELLRIQLNHDLLVQLVLDYCEHRGIIGHDKLAMLAGRGYKGAVSSSPETPAPAGEPGEMSASEKIARLRRVREALMTDRNIREAAADVLQLDPGFSRTHLSLFFQLKQFEFRDCLRQGMSAEALAISTNDLAPIAKIMPELEPALRSTLLLLAFPPQTPLPRGVAQLSQHPSSIAGPLCTLLGQKLRIGEPRILKMIKYLCCVHTEWFRQIIIPDRFERLFRLNELKKPEAPQFPEAPANRLPAPAPGPPVGAPAGAPRAAGGAPSGGGGGGVGGGPGAPPAPAGVVTPPVGVGVVGVAGGGPAGMGAGAGVPEPAHPMEEDPEALDEGSVNTLMEIMGFTREQAVMLLQENGGDINEVLQLLIG